VVKYRYLLFALMQIGNPKDCEKKIKPGPMLPDIVGTGQANTHEQSL
jgi:hypothetical protein